MQTSWAQTCSICNIPWKMQKKTCAWVYKHLLDTYLYIFITKVCIRHCTKPPNQSAVPSYDLSLKVPSFTVSHTKKKRKVIVFLNYMYSCQLSSYNLSDKKKKKRKIIRKILAFCGWVSSSSMPPAKVV